MVWVYVSPLHQAQRGGIELISSLRQSLPRAKLAPHVCRKVLLEARKYKASEALEDGIVDAIAPPEKMFDVALELANRWKSKAKMGVYGVLRNELVGEATRACKPSPSDCSFKKRICANMYCFR